MTLLLQSNFSYFKLSAAQQAKKGDSPAIKQKPDINKQKSDVNHTNKTENDKNINSKLSIKTENKNDNKSENKAPEGPSKLGNETQQINEKSKKTKDSLSNEIDIQSMQEMMQQISDIKSIDDLRNILTSSGIPDPLLSCLLDNINVLFELKNVMASADITLSQKFLKENKKIILEIAISAVRTFRKQILELLTSNGLDVAQALDLAKVYILKMEQENPGQLFLTIEDIEKLFEELK
jgi:hypothetical protein